MYFFLSSTDCLDSYPDNHPWNFTVNLGQYYHLKERDRLALLDIQFDGKSSQDLYVFCDSVSSSYVNGAYLPSLRVVRQSRSSGFPTPYFIPARIHTTNSLHIYIRTRQGRLPSFTPKEVRCTVQLRQHGHL